MSGRRLRIRLAASSGALLLAAAAVATVYGAGPLPGHRPSPSLTELAATGAISISDSKEGGAIFTLSNFAPGMTGAGEVSIGNTGSAPGDLTLSTSDRSDSPGFYGGALSERLGLVLTDVDGSGRRIVYAGDLWSMPSLDLGTLAAGESRTYRFAVKMRDQGAPSTPYVGDNLYQRASASLGFRWTLTELEGEPPSEPPAAEPPGPPAPPASEVPPTSAPAPPPPATPRSPHVLIGTRRADRLAGTPEDDLIRGLAGADTISGRAGDDHLLGGPGADRIIGGPGSDLLVGGAGADVIHAEDGERDVVDCGPGTDVAYLDAGDRATHCERTRRSRPYPPPTLDRMRRSPDGTRTGRS
ncbi:MAG TPA: calcium-binding protein [Solirubrobacterales bacterium]|nr:calcium-binding protein [Solirubrobacterales bacterium]